MIYADSVHLNQQMIVYFEAEDMYDKPIYPHFLLMQLGHPYVGYVKSDRRFTSIKVKPSRSRYAMFTSDQKDEFLEKIRNEGWTTLKVFEEGKVQGEILVNPNEPIPANME